MASGAEFQGNGLANSTEEVSAIAEAPQTRSPERPCRIREDRQIPSTRRYTTPVGSLWSSRSGNRIDAVLFFKVISAVGSAAKEFQDVTSLDRLWIILALPVGTSDVAWAQFLRTD